MKQIDLGGHNYYLIENAMDCTLRRYAELQKYTIAGEWGVSAAALRQRLGEYMEAFDQQKMAACLLSLYEASRGLDFLAEGKTALDYLVALTVLNEEEVDSPNETVHLSQDYLRRKAEQLSAHGLTQGRAARLYADFVKASPESFRADSAIFLERHRKGATPS